MKPTRIIANAVGGMLFIQVILGGLSVLLNVPVTYHIIWGVVTFVVLVVATVFAARDYGRMSGMFKIGLAAIADYIIQGILGFFALSSDAVVVIHLTNAFVLAVLATYLISNADRAESMVKTHPSAATMTTGSTTKNVA
jgi:heme A synthase